MSDAGSWLHKNSTGVRPSVVSAARLLYSFASCLIVGITLLFVYAWQAKRLRLALQDQTLCSSKVPRTNLRARLPTCSQPVLWPGHSELLSGVCRLTGLDSALYLSTLHGFATFFCILSLASALWLSPIYLINPGEGDALMAFTIVNLTQTSSQQRWTALFAQILLTASSYLFLTCQRYKLVGLKFAYETAHPDFGPSQHTLLIRNVPPSIDRATLLEHLDQMYPGEILDVQCVLNHSQLLAAEQQLDRSVDKMCRIHSKRQRSLQRESACGFYRYWDWKLHRARVQVRKIQHNVHRIARQPVTGTGAAYVSFTTINSALRFLKNFRTAPRQIRDSRFYTNRSRSSASCPTSLHLTMLREGSKDWKVCHAPRQSDILWANSGYTRHARRQRQALTCFILFAVGAILTMLVLLVILFFGSTYIGIRFDLQATSDDSANTWTRKKLEHMFRGVRSLMGRTYPILVVVPPIILVVVKASSRSFLQSLAHYERHLTASRREEAYLGKSFLAFFIVNLFWPTLAYRLLAQWHTRGVDGDTEIVFIEFVVSSAITVFLIETFVYSPIRIIAGFPVFRYREKLRTPDSFGQLGADLEEGSELHGTATVHTLNSGNHGRYKIEDGNDSPRPFDLSQNYAEALSMFAVSLVYAVVCPLISPVAALFFGTKYLADRYILLNQYAGAVAQPTFSRRVRAVNRYSCLGICLAQLGPCWFFIFVSPHDNAANKLICVAFSMLCLTCCIFLIHMCQAVLFSGRDLDLPDNAREQHVDQAELHKKRKMNLAFCAPKSVNSLDALSAGRTHPQVIAILGDDVQSKLEMFVPVGDCASMRGFVCNPMLRKSLLESERDSKCHGSEACTEAA